MKSQFLTLWDGLLSENDSQIVVLGATNRRQDIDEAFLRRMPLQIKINLPNSKQREKILRILLSDIPLSRTFSFAAIVSQTEGLSGSDLKEICRRVIMNASTTSDEPYLHSSSFDQAISRFTSEMAHDMSHFNM
jgi:SpoVK/Ycf46/Vps4 family AAA+-type ATPase